MKVRTDWETRVLKSEGEVVNVDHRSHFQTIGNNLRSHIFQQHIMNLSFAPLQYSDVNGGAHRPGDSCLEICRWSGECWQSPVAYFQIAWNNFHLPGSIYLDSHYFKSTMMGRRWMVVFVKFGGWQGVKDRRLAWHYARSHMAGLTTIDSSYG